MSESTKTDLSRILAASGQRGLYAFVSSARNGAIVEALADGRRTCFDSRCRITSLSDISIYTEDGELKLQEVFEKMHAFLGEADAPTSKASADELKSLFASAVPDYDGSRFYVSHMKKVVDWYNELKAKASLDFETPQEAEAEEAAEVEEPVVDPVND